MQSDPTGRLNIPPSPSDGSPDAPRPGSNVVHTGDLKKGAGEFVSGWEDLKVQLVTLGFTIAREIFPPRAGGGGLLEVEAPDGRRYLILVPARIWRRSHVERRLLREKERPEGFYLQEAQVLLLASTESVSFPLDRQKELLDAFLLRVEREGFRQGTELEFLLGQASHAEARQMSELTPEQIQRIDSILLDMTRHVLSAAAFELLTSQREVALPPSSFLSKRKNTPALLVEP